MMCGRTTTLNEDVSRDAVSSEIREKRLNGYAENLIRELRSKARIVRK